MSDDLIDERVSDEIEALKAILLDEELDIKENESGVPEAIEVLVFPSTAEDSQSQYVCVRLVVKIVPGYPDVCPIVSLRNPRGLDEKSVNLIETEAEDKCKLFVGQPVMFELIQLVREHLTRNNLPTGQCAVCLYGFREGDEFTKTECYHHFHSRCLAAHVAAAERYYKEEQDKLPQWQQDTKNKFQAICPVCRESINCDVESLWSAPPPIDLEAATEFSVTAELRELQKQMSALFLKQQARGGIIDPEAEDVKMLVRTEDEQSNASQNEPSHPPGTSLNSSQSTMRENKHQNAQSQQKEQKEQKEPTVAQQSHSSNRQNHQNHSRHYQGHRNRGRGNRSSHYRRHFDNKKQTDTAAPR